MRMPALPRPSGATVSDPLASRPDHSALARLRDHLYAHGPCSVLEAARAGRRDSGAGGMRSRRAR